MVEYFGEDVLEPMEPEFEWDVEELLRRFLRREESRVEAELAEVERLLEGRERLHWENVEEVKSKLEWYVDRLRQEYKRSKDRERISELKSEIRSFYAELRSLERERWLDVQELERECRGLERELEELSDQDMVRELLGG